MSEPMPAARPPAPAPAFTVAPAAVAAAATAVDAMTDRLRDAILSAGGALADAGVGSWLADAAAGRIVDVMFDQLNAIAHGLEDARAALATAATAYVSSDGRAVATLRAAGPEAGW
jgi:hypothetical protein